MNFRSDRWLEFQAVFPTGPKQESGLWLNVAGNDRGGQASRWFFGQRKCSLAGRLINCFNLSGMVTESSSVVSEDARGYLDGIVDYAITVRARVQRIHPFALYRHKPKVPACLSGRT